MDLIVLYNLKILGPDPINLDNKFSVYLFKTDKFIDSSN